MRLIVDGMNVIGSRPDGWWRDREAAMRRLVAALNERARQTGEDVLVVLDARSFDLGEEDNGVDVLFAPGGPNAADDEIVRVVRAEPDPGEVRVATSDKDLVRRVEALGAEVMPARELRVGLSM
jgi:predicted RNA-binding protein with PIN domain